MSGTKNGGAYCAAAGDGAAEKSHYVKSTDGWIGADNFQYGDKIMKW